MSRKLAKKLMYAIVVMAVLAMMIPMSIPVSAAPSFTMLIQDAETGQWVVDGNIVAGTAHAFNVSGTTVRILATEPVDNWTLKDETIGYKEGFNSGPSVILAENSTAIDFTGVFGETTVKANGVKVATKKWGVDIVTDIQAPQTTLVTWNESAKNFSATGSVTDYAYATFIDNTTFYSHAAQGVILHWYLVSGGYAVNTTPDAATTLIALYDSSAVAKAKYVEFYEYGPLDPWDYDTWNGTSYVTTTDIQGKSTVNIAAWFEEDVQVVVIPEYPDNPNISVTPEVTTFNFETREYEVVPQVRWAGEKIVLEANFGMPGDVLFYFQNQSVGTLEGIDNNSAVADTLWTRVNPVTGIASAILYSAVSGQADVIAAFYPDGESSAVENQHAFRVYFLNFESLTLGNVPGKRADHYAGLWEPGNPFNAENDTLEQTLNVAQDALERATVRGWFVPPQGSQMSTRPAACINIDADDQFGMNYDDPNNPVPNDLDDVLAPAGRWILPDDWHRLGGYTNWEQRRIHWDIMDAPGDTLTFTLNDITTVNVGPFAPGIEKMTPNGWMPSNPTVDSYRPYNTVIPNQALDKWDAPMPPAKIIFEITDGNGFFKEAMKTDIYYTGSGANLKYTAPFYRILIPAHEFIPAFNNEFGGGYDWLSFGKNSMGPYEFWTVFNRSSLDPAVDSDDWAKYPTKVEVYSDNHGEAMVWLNGDYNLALSDSGTHVNALYDQTVGITTVRALADYPYVRADQPIVSNDCVKTWKWGALELGVDNNFLGSVYTASTEKGTLLNGAMINVAGCTDDIILASGYDYDDVDARGTSKYHVAWLWITDRAGRQNGVEGAKVRWEILGTTNSVFGDYDMDVVGSGMNPCHYSKEVYITNGFLQDTNGVLISSKIATSETRKPRTAEAAMFEMFYPGCDADDFVVAAIMVYSPGTITNPAVDIDVQITSKEYRKNYASEGMIARVINLDPSEVYPLDDAPLAGDANLDGEINMMDITATERVILGMDTARPSEADANRNGVIDMGDVIRIEKMYLGIN